MAEDPEAAKLKAFKLRLVLVPPSTVCSYIEPLEKAPEGCLDSNAHIQDGMEPVMFGLDSRTSLGLSMPTRRSLLTTQLDRLGRSKVTELCSRTGTELDLADQTLVVVSISTPVGQIPFSVPQIASRLTRCACCLASRSDRTSVVALAHPRARAARCTVRSM